MRLGAKINLALSFVIILAIASIVVILNTRIRALAIQTSYHRIASEAEVAQRRFDEALEELKINVGSVRNTSSLIAAVEGGNKTQIWSELLKSSAAYKFDDIDLVDTRGRRLITMHEEGATYDEEQEDALLRLALLGTTTADIMVFEYEGEMEVRLAAVADVRDSSGDIIGGLIVSHTVDDEYLSEINLSRENPHLALLVAGQIASYDQWNTEEIEDYLSRIDETSITQAQSGQIVFAEDTFNLDRTPFAAGYAPLVSKGKVKAVVAILDNLDVLLAEQAPLLQATTITIILLGVIGLVLVAQASRRLITLPIGRLQDVVQEITKGDYSRRVETTANDEIGILANSFNEMTGVIEHRTRELEERNREMDASQRVTFAASERTTPEDFLDLLVNLIADQFDVYHCQVYLVDEERENAVLEQSTGYAGRQLLQRGHMIPLDQEALVTQCIKTGESVLVGDVAENPGWLPNPLLPYTQSELVVPLKIEDEVIGALDIQDRVAGRFTEQTVPVFATMTEHVASLFQTTELLEEIEKRTIQIEQTARQLRIAAEIAERLNTITELEQLLEEAVNQLQTRFGFYHAHIYLLDENGEDLVVQAGSGHVGLTLKREKHSIPLSREDSLVARAGRTRQPVVASDVQTEEGFMPNPMLPDTRSEAAIPLVSGERLLGVLDMQDEQVDRFTQADVDTLTTLVGQMTSSIESAELFGQVKLERAQAEALYEISNKLNTAQSKDEILHILSEMAIESGASLTNLISLTVDERGNPEWAEIEASFKADSTAEIRGMAVGERFYMPDMPFAKIWLAEQHAARMIADVKTDESLDDGSRELLLHDGVQSTVIIPLSQADTWLGFVTFNWSRPHAFSPTEMQVYNSLIGLASQAFASQKLLEARRDSEARYRTLVENAPEAIVVLDVGSGLFIEANQNAADLYGFATSTELIGKDPAVDLCPQFQPDGRSSVEAFKSYVAEAVEGSTPVFDWMHMKSQGEMIPCEIRLVRLPGGDKPMVRASITDITERKIAQDTIIQGDRLKSEFLANMSHELRTPLNSIIGYTDVLILGVDGEVSDEVMKDLKAINENSQTLLRLIDDILDLAKIEAGRMVLELSKIDVRGMLEDVIKNNAGLLVNKPVELNLEVKEELPTLKADYVRVVQMLNNLLSNAIKFTEVGEIILRAKRDGHDFICMEVQDTGVGIAKEDIELIFDEFQQADNSSTRTVNGSGLGLAITRSLVHLHGGSIHVESELGKGSTFTILLPLEPNVPADVTVNGVHEEDPDTLFERENNRKKEITTSLK
jgi:PAS domain S-box-containing protein